MVPENGCSKPNFGRRRQFWEERELPVSWWGPTPEQLCSWAHCRSSLSHTLHFFLVGAGFGLTDDNSGNAGAGTAAPLGVVESHSCCCSSHSNSLSSWCSQWSARYSADALPMEQRERERKHWWIRVRGQAGTSRSHLSTLSACSGAPGEVRVTWAAAGTGLAAAEEAAKLFECKWKVEPPCEIAPGNGTDTPLMGGFTWQLYLPREALLCHRDTRLHSSR